MVKKNIIVICGPTASGKTALAVKTAEMLSEEKKILTDIKTLNKVEKEEISTKSDEICAEIISADSRQVYRKMDIGTGKDLSEYITDKYSVPYHCIDIRNPDELFTQYDYMIEFKKAFKLIKVKKRIPVLAGGTGLYIESVLKQYHMEKIDPDYELRKKLEKKEKNELEKILENLNKDIFSKTDLSSGKRIIRGIEKALYYKRQDNYICSMDFYSNSECMNILKHCSNYKEKSGVKGISDCLNKVLETDNTYTERSCRGELLNINPLVLVTRFKREELVARIEKRLDQRMEEGMIEEVKSLLDEGITPERMQFLGLEYRYISQYLIGQISFKSMREKLFTEIRRFSKRQTTYFRGMERRGIKVNYIDNAEPDIAFSIVRKHVFDV